MIRSSIAADGAIGRSGLATDLLPDSLPLIEAKNTTKAAIIQSCGANFAELKKEKYE